ncbi:MULTISPECIES: hypothetical protein [Marinomonas]|jgi:hypothetical protein|uniref:YjfB family protein n=1 Tax=Marinomonas arctica TaxID=383750 RepID=A0A7H1J8R3_9GAMM|nr:MULTISPECIES: hypothetical protein [Marinomonas]MCS7487225.1 hypothetical protein [Marinomonas sp. BSi20414]QNT06879.1 hypothetical protein IBG28_04345 [Marinomonas arctica]GGN33834.1 hypothetical protein GCM10011350_29690 [Marinomonas arctica]
MPSINGMSSPAMDYASEVYSANLAKAAQEQRGKQSLELLEAAAKSVTPAASSGSHTTTDNLGQNINVNV